MDNDGLDDPEEAEQSNGHANRRRERCQVRPPEIRVERLRNEERSQPIGNEEANLILESAHSEIFSCLTARRPRSLLSHASGCAQVKRYTGPASFSEIFSMRKKTFAYLGAQIIIAASALIVSGQNAPATLTIHADQPVSTVSPTLYGLMTEEINYSYEGGLYAEMVRNRTFRGDWSGILYWYLIEGGNAAAKMEID